MKRTAFRSGHQAMVEAFDIGAGNTIPDHPTLPPEDVRLLRARLILEEAFETIERGLGVQVFLRDGNGAPSDVVDFENLHFEIVGPGDLVELADGCADVAFVTTGTLSAAGIPDKPVQAEVDGNNLKKLYRQAKDANGKLMKPVGHKPPRIAEILDLFKPEAE